jgi:hypothetical protein
MLQYARANTTSMIEWATMRPQGDGVISAQAAHASGCGGNPAAPDIENDCPSGDRYCSIRRSSSAIATAAPTRRTKTSHQNWGPRLSSQGSGSDDWSESVEVTGPASPGGLLTR